MHHTNTTAHHGHQVGLNTARAMHSVSGLQTSGLVYGEAPPSTLLTATEEYDGTSFTTKSATMATARKRMSSNIGTSNTEALAASGHTPPTYSTATEEYVNNQEPNFLNTGQTWYNGTSKEFKYTSATTAESGLQVEIYQQLEAVYLAVEYKQLHLQLEVF